MVRVLPALLTVALLGSSQQFRSTVTAVPVEVRVTNGRGEPVRELTADDFTVKENGQVQRISVFEYHELGTDLGVSGGRTFLVVLARGGRLNEPSKALEGLANFARTGLLPADRIGVVAYRHVLPPTTDHEIVARFFERYRTTHEEADGLLDRDDRCMTFPCLVRHETRDAIDRVLGDDEIRDRFTELAGADSPQTVSYRTYPALRNALYFARTIIGEKHVIVLTQQPLGVGRPAEKVTDSYWFQEATSARATLHLINTQGIHGKMSGIPGLVASNLPSTLVRSRHLEFSEETGGSSSFFEYTDKALAKVERATRSYYLLAYYPTEQTAPDEYREVKVEVRRPGVKALYRQGYQAQAPIEKPLDARDAQTRGKLEYGLSWTASPDYSGANGQGHELALEASQRTPKDRDVQITIAFKPKFTVFVPRNDRYVAEVDVVLVAENEKRNEIGRLRQSITVDLSASEFETAQKRWPTFDLRFPVDGQARHVRGVLYQFDTDRLAMNRVKVKR